MKNKLIISKKVYISKSKMRIDRFEFEFENKEDTLAAKEALEKSNSICTIKAMSVEEL